MAKDFKSEFVNLMLGDCLERMKELPDNSLESIVCDPPYSLSFMNKKWDDALPTMEIWKEALRVAKPGAHLLAFGGTRTFHRLVCAIEDAGWEIRDSLCWMYGSGMPKGQNVSKQIDAQLKHGKSGSRYIRDIQENRPGEGFVGNDLNVNGILSGNKQTGHIVNNNPMHPEAAKWNGWNSSLKPSFEPIVLARKPLDGTIAANVLKWGCGALNIDACRIPTSENLNGGAYSESFRKRDDGWRFHGGGAGRSGLPGDERDEKGAGMYAPGSHAKSAYVQPTGRWPANIIHDGSEEVLSCFPDAPGQCGEVKGTEPSRIGDNGIYGHFDRSSQPCKPREEESKSAARFFYCAKASRSERGDFNNHTTVKPIALMRYLVRLVTPKGATVLDPFMGSGTTGIAALEEGCRFIGIEREPDYFDISNRRILGYSPLAEEEDDENEVKPESVEETTAPKKPKDTQMELCFV